MSVYLVPQCLRSRHSFDAAPIAMENTTTTLMCPTLETIRASKDTIPLAIVYPDMPCFQATLLVSHRDQPCEQSKSRLLFFSLWGRRVIDPRPLQQPSIALFSCRRRARPVRTMDARWTAAELDRRLGSCQTRVCCHSGQRQQCGCR